MLILLLILVVFAAVVCVVLALTWQEESVVTARMAMLRGERPSVEYKAVTKADPVTVRLIGPMANALGSKLEALMPTKWIRMIDEALLKAGQPLSRTGFMVVIVVTGGTLMALGLTLATASKFPPLQAVGALAVCAVMGVFFPRMWLGNKVRHRQKAIIRSLPDAFDLITVCVEAGLGLDAALAKVAEKVEGPFGEELAISLREVSMGKLRRDALKELAHRTAVPDLTSFINAVIQAESMGTSIAAVLRVQADQMRMKRRQRAEQQAHAAPIKMMFPLVLCIFPTLFIVILGPAGITLYQQLVAKQ